METLAILAEPQELPHPQSSARRQQLRELLASSKNDTSRPGPDNPWESYFGSSQIQKLKSKGDFFGRWGEEETTKFRCGIFEIVNAVVLHHESQPDENNRFRFTFADFLSRFAEFPEYSRLVKNPVYLHLIIARIHSGYYDPIMSNTSLEKSEDTMGILISLKWLEFQQDLLDIFFNAIMYHGSWHCYEKRKEVISVAIKGAKFAIERINAAPLTLDSVFEGLPLAYSHLVSSSPPMTKGDESDRLAVQELVRCVRGSQSEEVQEVFKQFRESMMQVKFQQTVAPSLSAFWETFGFALPDRLEEFEVLLAYRAGLDHPALQSPFQLHSTLELMTLFLILAGGHYGSDAQHTIRLKEAAIEFRNVLLPKIVLKAMVDAVGQEASVPKGQTQKGKKGGGSGKRNREDDEQAPSPGTDALGQLLSTHERRNPWPDDDLGSDSIRAKLRLVLDELSAVPQHADFAFPAIVRDYAYKRIVKPMDFFTMKYKLEVLNSYPAGVSDLIKDIDLMYDNSIKYNGTDARANESGAKLTEIIQSIRQNFYKTLEHHGLQL